VSEDAEARELEDACSALSLLNQRRAYEVARALQFAEHPTHTPGEETPDKAAGPGLSTDGDGGRR
jgi:hypothetical protein